MNESGNSSGSTPAPGWWLDSKGYWRTPSEAPPDIGLPAPSNEHFSGAACPRCEAGLRPEVRFCTRCGMRVDEDEGLATAGTATNGPSYSSTIPQLDAPESVEQIVESLCDLLPVEGRLVVCLDLAFRRPQRLEVQAGDDAEALTHEDRSRLMSAVEAACNSEGYASAEVDGGGDWVIMVWHLVNQGAFPLTARHASAVLSFRDLLLPAGMQPTSAADATALAAR